VVVDWLNRDLSDTKSQESELVRYVNDPLIWQNKYSASNATTFGASTTIFPDVCDKI
jgi:hypothetical protein